MSQDSFILALDQGTTSSRAILYDTRGVECSSANVPLAVQFPEDGWVEQRPEDIWSTQLQALKEAVADTPASKIKAIGITNQRETVLAWNPQSGEPLTPAVVWQCRRSAEICEKLRASDLADTVSEITGLVIDAYFSATKIAWLMEHTPGLSEKVAAGEAVFGTVDSWILYQLTRSSGAPVFATEASNACRTMLYQLTGADWDEDLLKHFSLTRKNLAELRPSVGDFGSTTLLGDAIPIRAILGDQQASLFGHGCITLDTVKCTFGTGAFLLLNAGSAPKRSDSGLLSSVAWDFSQERTYALEGSIFVAGALVQWLRDELGILSSAAESEERAARVDGTAGVVVVPAFVGLGAPYWDANARGAILGLTREANADHIVRAALESVCHQVADLIDTKEFSAVERIRIDGGMAANKVFCQSLADICNLMIALPQSTEITALGAARAAALGAGLFGSVEESVSKFGTSTAVKDMEYLPQLPSEERSKSRQHWKESVARVRS